MVLNLRKLLYFYMNTVFWEDSSPLAASRAFYWPVRGPCGDPAIHITSAEYHSRISISDILLLEPRTLA